MVWSGVLGAAMGVVATVISAFQFERGEASLGQVLAAGLIIGVPVTMGAGVFVGWLWDLWWGSKTGQANETRSLSRQDQVGSYKPARRKRR